ncbi:MAG TPA: uracil-DNA glycosylase [Baekduia sp.]|nr:uracil-DNA glycosylase [Baekduia sp.]
MPASELSDLHAEIVAHHGSGCGFEPCETCTQLVPGAGPSDAPIVVVGEAPGAKEDRSGLPFAGPSGRILNELLELAGLSRPEVFVTNVFKARPPGNRDPTAAEIAHHRPWLDRQLEIISPQLVVPLGRHALKRFAPDAKIGESHGKELEVGNLRVVALYHPAASLHNPRLRPVLEEDARALGALLR